MKIRALTRILLPLLLTTLPMPAIEAQDDLGDEASEVRRYAVEMIIFRYAQEVSTGSEVFLRERSAYDNSGDDEEPFFIDGEALEELAPVSRVYRDIEFKLLPEDQYTMGDVMARLKRLDVYEPLMHFAWSQATWPDEDTLPIELALLGTPPPGLDGTLRLYLGRYLHLVVDLQLDAPIEAVGAADRMDAMTNYGDDRSPRDSGLMGRSYGSAADAPLRYRIEENRILRSGELRYFDHPKFGVLAKIVRLEESPEALPESPESELLGYPAE